MELQDLMTNDTHVITYCSRPQASMSKQQSALIAWVPIVVEALKMAADVQKSQQLAKWQSNVAQKLDEINRKLDAIILELSQLRVWIDENGLAQFRRAFASEIESRRLLIQNILAGESWKPSPSRAAVRRISDQADALRVAMGQLADWNTYGFAGHYAVTSGCCTVLLIATAVKLPKAEVQSFARSFRDGFFKPAIDPQNYKSLEYARNQAASRAITEKNEFDSWMDKIFQINWGMRTTPHHGREGDGGDSYPVGRFALVHGNVESQPTFRFDVSATPLQTPPFPGLTVGRFDMGSGDVGPAQLHVIQTTEAKRAATLKEFGDELALREHIKHVQDIIGVLDQIIAA